MPDYLIIYTNYEQTDSLVFYTGEWLATSQPLMTTYGYSGGGYSEIEYENGYLTPIQLSSENKPLDYLNNTIAGGALRLWFTVPDSLCVLKFKVAGNKSTSTIYDIKIFLYETGFIEAVDTIYKDICSKRSPEFIGGDCKKSLVIYRDSSIQTPIEIKNSKCVESDDGSVIFANYPQFNQTGLKYGSYSIEISNSVCKKQFDFNIWIDGICNYYILNAVNPLSDKNNEFIFYLPDEGLEYKMQIFDRWGNKYFDNTCLTSSSGWIPKQNVSTGVYIYLIQFLDKKFAGDVTVIK